MPTLDDYEKKMAGFPVEKYTAFRFIRTEKGKIVAFLTGGKMPDTPVPVSSAAEAVGLKNAFYALRERL